MILKTKVHTIFLLVGPTECGKTTFAKEVLIPQLQFSDESRNFRMNVQYISSDDLRQELLGFPYDKYASNMLEASSQAFEMLFTKLKAVTSFPINAEFVILDTTGLSEDFRKRVLEIAEENHYQVDAVLFDYKKTDDFYASERSRKLISQHVSRFRREVMPAIRSKDFQRIHRKKEKNEDCEVVIENLPNYLESFLPQGFEYILVGDVHEKTAELMKLIESHGFSIKNGIIQSNEKSDKKRFVLVGDWIDKGKGTVDIIEFLTTNKDWFFFVKGNHENFVSKFLIGEINKNNIEQHLIETYFDSIEILEQDQELADKFQELVKISKEFYRFNGSSDPSFYITHAPCENKYLGKMTALGLKKQRVLALDRNESYEEQLSFIKSEAVGNHPFHVFGHVATKNAYRVKNKLGIDTGAVHGNALTSVMLNSERPFYKSVKSESVIMEDLPFLFGRQDQGIKVMELEGPDLKRLNYVLENQINFISGTMSPADKDKEANELESLTKGLDYFREKGVEQVVLQPKYMGSRCNLYLSKEPELSYAVSRNGYKIQHVDLTPVFEKMKKRFSAFMDEHGIKTLILDGELLPWKALGKGLIENQFAVAVKGLETEISFLKEHGFNEHYSKLKERYMQTDFDAEENKLPKKDLMDKYGHNEYSTFVNLKEALRTYYPIEEHEAAFKVFEEQLEIYGADLDLDYKPFSILKMVKEDGTEDIPKLMQSEMFSLISEDDYVLISLQEEGEYEKAQTFFHELTTIRRMEGVVIKPEIKQTHTAPFMKVRNPEYLTIVYGYDYRFPHKLEKLIKQKDIRKKLRTSIEENKLGEEMLSFKLDEISPQNVQYKQVVANMLFEESKEKEIDPRL